MRLTLLLFVCINFAACSSSEHSVNGGLNESKPVVALRAQPKTASLLTAGSQPEVASSDAPLAEARELVLGRDYVEIKRGRPLQPRQGQIEVVEVFAYWCHFCAEFEPLISTWKKSLRADVNFTYVPAAFSSNDAFAQAFHAAEVSGLVEETHQPIFSAVHVKKTLPKNASVKEVANFYARYGVEANSFAATMQSFAVHAKLKRSRQFALDSGVEGTPTLIVNGRFRVLGTSLSDSLRIADQLIDLERARTTSTKPDAASPRTAHLGRRGDETAGSKWIRL